MAGSSTRQALDAAVDALRAAGVSDPRFDAELLLAEAIGQGRAQLATNPQAGIPPPAARRFAEMVRRRLRREPVAYILGRRGFRHLELAVDPRVLIPRPETELLVELALELRPRSVLDVGTGSGALALAIAAELHEAEVTATDTSAGALAVAAANAERLGLAARVELFEGTLPPGGEEFDLVVANLPYVSEREWGGLQREVTEWEPREALLAGPDGLDVLRSAVPALTAVTGILALEIGQGQAAAVGELLREAGCQAVESRPDLAGIERLVIGHREAVA
ncbi:MAG TPA: peptide chain release factor N(5)-glutamine methyltransferase [Solirubrobacterales bacterium]|nr:peptide chain release factor N(5)-glutamine methyltransferase [Solirubrobacterales bacterium]